MVWQELIEQINNFPGFRTTCRRDGIDGGGCRHALVRQGLLTRDYPPLA